MAGLYFEDFEIGDRIRSIRRTIAEGESMAFNSLVMDHHPYVSDERFALEEGVFGRRLVAGAFVFSLGLGLAATNCLNSFSYGYDRLRFIKPVFIGDTLRVGYKVTENVELIAGAQNLLDQYPVDNPWAGIAGAPKVGDKVLFGKYSGTEVKIDGKEYEIEVAEDGTLLEKKLAKDDDDAKDGRAKDDDKNDNDKNDDK